MWVTNFKEQGVELDPEVHDYIVQLQAQIAELEEEVDRMSEYDRRIKAEGIEGMREYFSLSNDGTYTDQDIDEYLGKLRD